MIAGMGEIELFKRVGLALAIGLLMGIERGWHSRTESSGMRIAGVRSFALIGLLGGIVGLLSIIAGELLLALAFLGFAVLVAAPYMISVLREVHPDFGITTEVAELLTFALGVVAVRGDMALPRRAGSWPRPCLRSSHGCTAGSPGSSSSSLPPGSSCW